ncbi:2-oxo acid dehydrogenase subunit E2 [Ensifer sp. BR816]|uniref:2-oxo acid dehydrogenase subunit E2 n=1 Tax=Rhizobium sp. (strain BR816) TaxID=1057002 RepID=UPI000A03EE2A|nr:2-oxo acid dehydrogenase subunit E2 [Ensifer sp. BR816]
MPVSFTEVPLTPLRKAIAARMTQAKQTVPHFRLIAKIEVDKLMAWRTAFNEADPASKVSINDCIIRAVALSLIENPAINSRMAEKHIERVHTADISVVIAVQGGLATPVVRGAEKKSLRAIAAEVKGFTERAGRNALKMNEISGGSFSISNLGGYGVEQFDAIINVPQCAILAVGKATPIVVPATDGAVKVATVVTFTLSVDHRAIDGAEAGRFLQTLREVITHPERLA